MGEEVIRRCYLRCKYHLTSFPGKRAGSELSLSSSVSIRRCLFWLQSQKQPDLQLQQSFRKSTGWLRETQSLALKTPHHRPGPMKSSWAPDQLEYNWMCVTQIWTLPHGVDVPNTQPGSFMSSQRERPRGTDPNMSSHINSNVCVTSWTLTTASYPLPHS